LTLLILGARVLHRISIVGVWQKSRVKRGLREHLLCDGFSRVRMFLMASGPAKTRMLLQVDRYAFLVFVRERLYVSSARFEQIFLVHILLWRVYAATSLRSIVPKGENGTVLAAVQGQTICKGECP
jgi:hypothetical protein